MERWFLKTAINQMFRGDRSIGSADAPRGWPAPELVEAVFGRRRLRAPAGFFHLVREGLQFNFAERFESVFYSRLPNGFYSGCIITFRTMVFGVHFESTPLPDKFFDGIRVQGMADAVMLQPFNEMNSPLGITLRIDW